MTRDEFYGDTDVGRKRERSGEMDFGVWWAWDHGQGFPKHRLSVIQDTGEIYLCRFSKPEEYIVIGKVPDVAGEILTSENCYDLAEFHLNGWPDGHPSLEWLSARIPQTITVAS